MNIGSLYKHKRKKVFRRLIAIDENTEMATLEAEVRYGSDGWGFTQDSFKKYEISFKSFKKFYRLARPTD